MDMDTAAVFLAGSILTMLGFIVIVVGCIVINNLLAKYWKDLGWFSNWFHWNNEPVRFATDEEAKTLDKTQEPKL
jgi:hypothetical protein